MTNKTLNKRWTSSKRSSRATQNRTRLHFDAGTAAYKLGDYDKALEAFGQAVTTRDPGTRAKAEYNIGNTLFQRGAKQEEKPAKIHEWRNAIEHYDEALKSQPNDENAKVNRDTVQKLIAELEKEPPKQQQQNQQQQQQNQQKNQQQNQQNQQQQNQQNQQQQKNQSQQNQNQQNQQQQQQNQQNQNQQPATATAKLRAIKPAEIAKWESAAKPAAERIGAESVAAKSFPI